ncbi:1 [Durusdinium trenchii]|uniref:1 n=1 Tax=Durusdinium trenchii TaxID=1381693 RepID=A0ABP0JZ15_9DINO
MNALQTAGSSYSEPHPGVGIVVDMKLDSLSLPSGKVAGVKLCDNLTGEVRDMVEKFEDHLLQDASLWTDLENEAAKIRTYNDPMLSSKAGYISFLKQLYQSMSILRRLYDFIHSGCQPRRLNHQEQQECRIFSGIVTLLVGDLRRQWSSVITASDASPSGWGICELESSPLVAQLHGRWQERWRYRRLDPGEWRPAKRALHRDPFSDPLSVKAGLEEINNYTSNEGFPEIPLSLLDPQNWKTVSMGKWKHTEEHITLKEARSLLIATRRLSRAQRHRRKRHLILLDNMALCFALAKGRSARFDMLRVLQRVGSICLACGITLRPRWVPSEFNIADAPSRGFRSPGSGTKESNDFGSQNQLIQGASDQVGAEEGGRQESDEAHGESGAQSSEKDARVAALPKKSVVRRPPPPRRSVQPLPAVVQDQDVGKLAQQKKLTLLERKCVSSEVQGQYGQYLSRFEDFCRVGGFHWPPALQDVDPLLSDYMDTLFMEGRSPHEGEKTFAALEFHMLEVKGKLHRARRCLKGWRKAVPAQSRLPMPMLAMFGIAMTLAAGNHLEMALKTVVGFLLYLRPGEGLDLRSRNVVAPVRGAGIQYKWVTVIIRDQEGQRPDKTGVFDNSLAIDHTLWAGEQLLLRAKKAPTKDSLIFNFSMDNSRREAGVGKPTPLPAATRGGDGGPVLPSKGVQCRQSPWALEERCKCETLRKGGQGAGVLFLLETNFTYGVFLTLSGRDADGVFMTLRAQPYPLPMTGAFAQLALGHFNMSAGSL